MKKHTIIIIILCCICNIYAKNLNNLNLQKSNNNLSIESQIKILRNFILQYYNSSFKYYNELKNGTYIIKYSKSGKNKKYLYINIVNKVNNKDIDKIKLLKNFNNDGTFNIKIDQKDLNRFLDSKSQPYKNRKLNFDDNVQLVIKDSILSDQVIISDDNLPLAYWTKILNRTYTRSYLVDQNKEKSVLFKNCIAAKIIPYGSGEESKILGLDNQFHSIIYFDSDAPLGSGIPLNRCYGYGGNSDGQFLNPTGFTLGRPSDDVYPVYIADFNNSRIIKVNYFIDQSSGGIGIFDSTSFIVFKNIPWPYDISYFMGNSSSEDKIWLSEEYLQHSAINCFKTNGIQLARCIGYVYDVTGESFFFNPGIEIRFDVYNSGFPAISFIDKERNCLVSCLLNEDGTPIISLTEEGSIIVANDIQYFPENEHINSVSFHRTSIQTELWPYVWITSPNYIHCCKMNTNAHIQYLASARKPFNTDYNFSELLNLSMAEGYCDIFSIENWNDSYGMRRYLPFAGLYFDTLNSYCQDSLNIMKFKATFTNDCWVHMIAQRLNNNDEWETVKIKSIDGEVINDNYAYIFRFAGWNQAAEALYIDIKLDLPIKDYTLGGQIKLSMNVFPEYYNQLNLENPHISKEYISVIQRTCLPRPGGCPFLYVKDVNEDYIADNNVLHKSEFSDGDITDKYKLRIAPLTNNDEIELDLVENENDNGYINFVKLYAIDHLASQKMAITEDNQIVLYDSVYVVASDSVMFDDLNITSNVNFHNPAVNPTIGGDSSYMYAHFPYMLSKNKFNVKSDNLKKSENSGNNKKSKNNGKKNEESVSDASILSNEPIAFITNMGNLTYPNTSNKVNAGQLTATSIYSNRVEKSFARREYNTEVVIPLFSESDNLDHVDIDFYEDFQMKYIGVTNNLLYSGYTETEVQLFEGRYITSTVDSNIIDALTYIDESYCEVNSSALIKMKFDTRNLPSLGEDYVREYVFEVNGRYYRGDDKSVKKGNNEIPLTYNLSQNYPNPFNPITKIKYEIPKTQIVNLIIYDILGREVKRLVNNEMKQAGRYVVEFDGTNYASGVYFFRIEAGSFVQSKKMVLVK